MVNPLRWASDNPLRTAGAVSALAAMGYLLVASGATAPETTAGASTTTSASLSTVVAFAMAHPAYPVLLVVGVSAFLFLD